MRRHLVAAIGGALIVVGAPAARAQQGVDPVFARARQLVVNGNGSAGRLLIDSVLSATPAESPIHGEALYWRAALAATSSDAERDYRRLVVEYPLSPHVGDALLQLAQLESAHGDRASAATHLEQFLADNPRSADRPRAVLLYVRMLLEQNDLPRGCSVLRQTLRDLPDSAIETRNQLEYYSPRCAAADVSPGGAVPVSAPTATEKTPVSPRDSAKSGAAKGDAVKAPATKERFTLQVAAYKRKADAEALAKKLKARKLDARVAASGSLYRVRVGKYATRAEAVAAQKALKVKKIDAFVAELGPDDT